MTINKCNICFNWVLKVWMTEIMLSLFTDNVTNTLLHIYPSLSSLVWLHTSMRTGGGGRGAIYIFSWHRFIWMFCFFQIFVMSQINKKDMNYWFDQPQWFDLGFHTSKSIIVRKWLLLRFKRCWTKSWLWKVTHYVSQILQSKCL